MMVSLVARERSRFDEFLDDRVVDGYLLDFVVLERIDPAVPNIEDREERVAILKCKQCTGDGSSHAELRVARELANVVRGFLKRSIDCPWCAEAGAANIREPLRDCGTGQITGRVSAHPVRHRKDRRNRYKTIFVCRAAKANVGCRRPGEDNDLTVASRYGHGQFRIAAADLGHGCLSTLLSRALHWKYL
ncbi:MAG: hypothetical protein Q8M65_09670, partial [Rhodoglobus sp.]|nr:hypothetical protein [Rhodoglobus sp.]